MLPGVLPVAGGREWGAGTALTTLKYILVIVLTQEFLQIIIIERTLFILSPAQDCRSKVKKIPVFISALSCPAPTAPALRFPQ